MGLCHQVLSRSQMNAVMKLREAGIVTYNLVVVPHRLDPPRWTILYPESWGVITSYSIHYTKLYE